MFKKLAKTAIKKIGSGNKQKFSATMGASGETKAGKRIALPKDLAGKKFTASSVDDLQKKVAKAMKDLDRRVYTKKDGSLGYRKKTLGQKASSVATNPVATYATGLGLGGATGYLIGKGKNKKKPKPTTMMAARKKRTSKG